MDWSDEGIFLSAKPLGEANAVAELFTLGAHLATPPGHAKTAVLPAISPSRPRRPTVPITTRSISCSLDAYLSWSRRMSWSPMKRKRKCRG